MTGRFKVGDQVTWNSEAGHVSGTLITVHSRNIDYKEYTHRATTDDPSMKSRATTSRCTKARR